MLDLELPPPALLASPDTLSLTIGKSFVSLYDPAAKVFARRITLSGLCEGYPRALANAAWDIVERVTRNEVTRSPLLRP